MRLPPDNNSLNLHIMHVNYLAYIQRHPELRNHPSPIGWEMINCHCRPIRYTNVDLPAKLTPHPSKEQMFQSVSNIYLNQTQTKDKNVVATKIILVTYLMLLNEILIRVTFSIKTKLYTCLKSFNLLGFLQCESGILWCWQILNVAC